MAKSGGFRRGGQSTKSGMDSDKEYMAFVKAVKAPSDFKEIFKNFEFAGFDPVQIFKRIMEIGKAKSYNEQQINDAVFVMVTYFAKRGTNVSQAALMKSSPECAEMMENIVSDFEIKSNLKGRTSNNALTLQRVAAAFPHIMQALAFAGQIRSGKKVEGLPEHFHWPGATAMMDDGEYTKYFEPYCVYMVELSRVINTKNAEYKTKSAEEIYAMQANFAQIQHDSTFNMNTRDDRRAVALDLAKQLGVTKPAF